MIPTKGQREGTTPQNLDESHGEEHRIGCLYKSHLATDEKSSMAKKLNFDQCELSNDGICESFGCKMAEIRYSKTVNFRILL